MSNQIATLNAQLPAFLQNVAFDSAADELEQNVRGSYAIVSVKGKVFAVKFGGETQQVLNEQGYPAQYLDVIIVAANANLTKTYYATTFTDDAAERPDCWSEDGITPSAPNPVNHICATCPKKKPLKPWNRPGRSAMRLSPSVWTVRRWATRRASSSAYSIKHAVRAT